MTCKIKMSDLFPPPCYGEVHIGKLIRSAGGRWNKKIKLWELPLSDVEALGLEDRIVKKGDQCA